MSPTTAEWLRFGSNIAVAVSVFTLAWKAEIRASRNESIRARQAIVNDIRGWAKEGIDLLTNIANELEKSASSTAVTLGKVSATIEEGRLFFENTSREGYGLHKSPSHRGLRPRILSWLVFASQVATTYAGEDLGEQIQIVLELRNHFVSDCQELIFPGKFGSLTMEDLDSQFKKGDFMDPTDGHPAIVKAKDFILGDHKPRSVIFV